MKKALPSLIIVFLFLLPVVLAQSDAISRGLLRGILGPMPQACSLSLNSADCIACIGSVKILPFIFFFGISYFAMSYLVFRMFGGLPKMGGQDQPLNLKAITPSFYFAIILIALFFGFLALHVREVSFLFINLSMLQQILILTFSAVIIVSFLYAIQSLSPMLGLVVLLFSIGIIWTLYTSLVEPGGLFSLEPNLQIRDNPCFLLE